MKTLKQKARLSTFDVLDRNAVVNVQAVNTLMSVLKKCTNVSVDTRRNFVGFLFSIPTKVHYLNEQKQLLKLFKSDQPSTLIGTSVANINRMSKVLSSHGVLKLVGDVWVADSEKLDVLNKHIPYNLKKEHFYVKVKYNVVDLRGNIFKQKLVDAVMEYCLDFTDYHAAISSMKHIQSFGLNKTDISEYLEKKNIVAIPMTQEMSYKEDGAKIGMNINVRTGTIFVDKTFYVDTFNHWESSGNGTQGKRALIGARGPLDLDIEEMFSRIQMCKVQLDMMENHGTLQSKEVMKSWFKFRMWFQSKVSNSIAVISKYDYSHMLESQYDSRYISSVLNFRLNSLHWF